MKKFIAFLFAAVLGVSAGLFTASAYEVTQVTDETMASAYREGDHILVDRMLFPNLLKKEFKRGDVVVFPNSMYMETGEDDRMMKRIIGLPGEWISIKAGIVYVDGVPLDESAYLDGRQIGDMDAQYVSAGSYFVLGDNRMSSTDSRNETVGLVQKKDLQGKVIQQW